MDLFEMFGIKVEDQIEEKSKTSSKTENKQKKGKKVEKKAASAKTDAKKLVLPLTVYTGFNRPFLITGTGSTTDKTLRERIHDVARFLKSLKCSLPITRLIFRELLLMKMIWQIFPWSRMC